MSLDRQKWIIYGAYGYTGELVVEEAIAQGRRPIVAGRNEAKLKPIAEKFDLDYRVFSVNEASQKLEGAGTIINCAGPFDVTSEPMMDAAIQCGLNYFDITGEIPVFKAAHERHDLAKKNDSILCPGVGFDIVPTDCLGAMLKEALPEANKLELAFDFGTLPSVGTTVTGIQAIALGGVIRENGELKTVGHSHKIQKIPFSESPRWAASVPWGDVYTAQISTGIPSTTVYAVLPWVACWAFKIISPFRGLLGKPAMQKILISLSKKFLDAGPDEKARLEHRTRFWGKVTTEDGRECTGELIAPSTYAMTAETAVAIALASETSNKGGGYFTTSMLVGADFLSQRQGFQMKISKVKKS